jgi:hypothetical protein
MMNETIETLLRCRAEQFGGRAAIVGKGPSFAEFDPAAHGNRYIVALNEVSRTMACDAAFVIDADILCSHGGQMGSHVRHDLITPRIPHRRKSSLGRLAVYGPVEGDGADREWVEAFEGRVRRFNLATSAADAALGDTYDAFNFSAPTVAGLLAASGFSDILLAGIDGGTSYATQFAAYEHKKLASVQDNFDVQFREFRQVRDRFGGRFSTIRCPSAHILIGAEPEQILAEEVLKWSIDSNSFLQIRYHRPPVATRTLFASGGAGTPFSFQRLFLPAAADHHGRGIYFDSDMLVFRDVFELFNGDMGGKVLLNCRSSNARPAQYAVFVVDNEAANWHAEALIEAVGSGELSYGDVIRTFGFVEQKAADLPSEWNSLELFEPGVTANLHYTDMGTQPWLSVHNRYGDLWCAALFKALAERPSVAEAFKLSVDKGWVRPSLRWQVEHGAAQPWAVPAKAYALDRDWTPPHVRLKPSRLPSAMTAARWRVASRYRRLVNSDEARKARLALSALHKVVFGRT